MYDLVGNPEDRFSRAGAQISAMKKMNWWPCTPFLINLKKILRRILLICYVTVMYGRLVCSYMHHCEDD